MFFIGSFPSGPYKNTTAVLGQQDVANVVIKVRTEVCIKLLQFWILAIVLYFI
jgi:hypothetical protein